jgi:hypothetical protein
MLGSGSVVKSLVPVASNIKKAALLIVAVSHALTQSSAISCNGKLFLDYLGEIQTQPSDLKPFTKGYWEEKTPWDSSLSSVLRNISEGCGLNASSPLVATSASGLQVGLDHVVKHSSGCDSTRLYAPWSTDSSIFDTSKNLLKIFRVSPPFLN